MVLCLSSFFDHCEDCLPVKVRVVGLNINSLQTAYSTFMPNTIVLKWNECKPMDVRDAN